MFLVTLCMVIKMNKKSWIIIAIIIILLVGTGIYFYFKNTSPNSNESNYEAGRTSANDTLKEGKNNNDKDNKNQEDFFNSDSDENERKQGIADAQNDSSPTTEEQIATFSTKIYNKDSARQNNISITCNTLNETIVKNGTTFSFCNTVGASSTSKGYQKADIFDKNGNKKKGLGGGNCQISTTLYNAVLSVPSLIVTERHAHSNSVPYIAKGKDAAVAYGSYDLKFRNDSGNDVKILASTDGTSVTITLLVIK